MASSRTMTTLDSRYTIEGMTQVKLILVDPTLSGSPHPLARR